MFTILVHEVKGVSMVRLAQKLSNFLYLAYYAWDQKQGTDDNLNTN